MSVQDSAAARLEMDAGSDPGVRFLRDPWWKRSLDVVAATTLLVLSLPLWVVVALLIKLDSPGPVLYVQQAIGRRGRPFRFYKFRTMHVGADNTQHRRYLRAFVQGGPLPEGEISSDRIVYKITADPRLTRVGRLLRRTSLDELPQLLNVFKGDMSLVGPRPPLPYEYELYDAWAKQRLSVRPGITGLYQISRRSRASFGEMVEIDLKYIRRRSLWLDLSIMLWTPAAMVLGRGAY
jgi:lipopolysaccharide/colanic/teichoic acid biosynthesis glycosyltransferase